MELTHEQEEVVNEFFEYYRWKSGKLFEDFTVVNITPEAIIVKVTIWIESEFDGYIEVMEIPYKN